MKIQRLLPLLVFAVLLLGVCDAASAQARVDRNVVYGMYSGTALLLDVHYPAKPNGFGIIFKRVISCDGSGTGRRVLRVDVHPGPLARAEDHGDAPIRGDLVLVGALDLLGCEGEHRTCY